MYTLLTVDNKGWIWADRREPLAGWGPLSIDNRVNHFPEEAWQSSGVKGKTFVLISGNSGLEKCCIHGSGREIFSPEFFQPCIMPLEERQKWLWITVNSRPYWSTSELRGERVRTFHGINQKVAVVVLVQASRWSVLGSGVGRGPSQHPWGPVLSWPQGQQLVGVHHQMRGKVPGLNHHTCQLFISKG